MAVHATYHYDVLVIGAGGVEKVMEIQLNADEKAMLEKSVGSVRTLIDACVQLDPSIAK